MVRMMVLAMAGAVLAIPGAGRAAAQDAEQEHGIVRATDPVSGATVTIYGPGGTTVYEVADDRASIRKDVSASASTTTIRAGGEVVTLTLDGRTVRLDEAGRALTVRRGDEAAGRELVRAARASRAVAAAIDLLQRVSRVQTSPIANAVLGTRVMLLTVSGDGDEGRRLGRAMVAARDEARLVPASMSMQLTAGECWDEYAAEAIETYMEYEDCVDSEQWWDLAGLASCLGIYEMRAIGAFTWWLSCVGLKK